MREVMQELRAACELRPCECGEAEELDLWDADGGWEVHCETCGKAGPVGDSLGAAMQAWNQQLGPCAKCGKALGAPLTTWACDGHSVMCMHEDCMAATDHHETREEAAQAWNAGAVSRQLGPCPKCGQQSGEVVSPLGLGDVWLGVCRRDDCQSVTSDYPTAEAATQAWNAGEVERC